LLAEAPAEGWAVQVGSNPSLDAAVLRQEELQAMGIDTYVVAALVGGNTWYRIRVGPFETREDASVRKNSLLSELDQDDIIVTPVR
jgi:cell division protein FtsN